MNRSENYLFIALALMIVWIIWPSGRTAEEAIASMRTDLEYLASDSLKGRGIGTPEELAAARYIASKFEAAGLSAMGDSASWLQEFSFVPKANPHVMETEGDSLSLGMGLVKKLTGHNVIGFLDNKADHTVVIGAHFDHLGMGGEGSLKPGSEEIHNGADDNASGVAALIELATRASSLGTNNNYLFIAFSGEERGLWGSNYYTKNPTYPLEKVNYMLNMDMVGRLNAEHKLATNGVGTSPAWIPALDVIQVDSITYIPSESGVGPSDHTSFYLKDIPVVHFFTGQHEDYHKPSDDAEKVNYIGLASVVAYIETLINLLDDDGKLEFVKTKDESEDNPRFTVTLGVVPDYMFSGEGMRIDGVSEGKTAQRTGLIAGDVIIALGDSSVVDMMGYMKALSSFSSGDSTSVKVRRGDEELSFQVVFD